VIFWSCATGPCGAIAGGGCNLRPLMVANYGPGARERQREVEEVVAIDGWMEQAEGVFRGNVFAMVVRSVLGLSGLAF
jgi:hypothetical protein